MSFWSTPPRTFGLGAFVLGGADLHSSQLTAAISKVEAEMAQINQMMVAVAADKDAVKALRANYIEKSKARDKLRVALRYAQSQEAKGVGPAPVAPSISHQACYDGPVPYGHFKRGVQTGSEEPFTVKGFIIQRSSVCDSGWMAFDASAAPRALAPATPLVRRRKL